MSLTAILFLNWEPVRVMEKRCDVTEFGRPVDEPNSTVLNFLKPVKKVKLVT